jgi:OFA family oxalate/formate antiporter-like MFS transporter
MAFGMLTTSLIPKTSGAVWLVYLTYGIIGGTGVGLAYNSVITCAQKWFPTKRGLATGVSVSAFGFSTVIFAPLVKAMIGQYDVGAGKFDRLGLTTTLQILAAAFALVTILLFRFVKLPESAGSGAAASAASISQKQYTTGEVLKTRSFYFIALSMMLLTAPYFILNPSFISFAGERGLDDAIGTVIVMLTGIASALGRLGTPLLADKIGRENATITIIAATAVSTAALCVNSGAVYIVAVAIIAFCYGGASGVYPLVTADYFGLKNVGSNYGAVMVGFMLSALFFPMIMGAIANMTVKFVLLAVLAAIGALLIVILSMTKKK